RLTVLVTLHLLHCTRPPPHLPSFPTRRSSDLPNEYRYCAGLNGRFRHPPGRRVFDHRAVAGGPAPLSPVCHISQQRDALPVPGRDRKSTRLNSSHLGISYAVFCLKKKKS